MGKTRKGLAWGKTEMIIHSGKGEYRKQTWVGLYLYGELAENHTQLKKGDTVHVIGVLSLEKWKYKEQNCSEVHLYVRNLELVGVGPSGPVPPLGAYNTGPKEPDPEDIPF